MYNTKDVVIVFGSSSAKQIVEIEKILSENIYYMHDDTSYAEHQIERLSNNNEKQNLFSSLVSENLSEILNPKKLAKAMFKLSDYYKQKYSI